MRVWPEDQWLPGEARIRGENQSLSHHLRYTGEIWRDGYEGAGVSDETFHRSPEELARYSPTRFADVEWQCLHLTVRSGLGCFGVWRPNGHGLR